MGLIQKAWDFIKKIGKSLQELWKKIKKLPALIYSWIQKGITAVMGLVDKLLRYFGDTKGPKKTAHNNCKMLKKIVVVWDMCYWSFVTFHLVWVKVQDLVVVAVDFLFKAVKSFAPNVNTGTHEGAKTACRFVRFVAILNPLANLAIFAGCVFAQRLLVLLVDVLDLLLHSITKLSVKLYNSLGKPDYLAASGITFRTKADAAVLCKWWEDNTAKLFLYGAFIFVCHAFARLSWGLMSSVNQVWHVFQRKVVKDAMGISNMGLDHALFRSTSACTWLATVEMGPLNAVVSIFCDLVNPILIDGIIFAGWVLRTIEETLMGKGRFYELTRDFVSIFMQALKKPFTDLFSSGSSDKVDGLGDDATDQVVADVARVVKEGKAAGKEIGGLAHVMDTIQRAIPVVMKYIHVVNVKIPWARTYKMWPGDACDVDGDNCKKFNPFAFGGILPVPKGLKYCTEKVYTCAPRTTGVAPLSTAQCLDLRLGKGAHKSEDYAVTGQCVVEPATTDVWEDVGSSNCGPEVVFTVEKVVDGLINTVERMGRACTLKADTSTPCTGAAVMFPVLATYLKKLRNKLKSTDDPVPSDTIKVTLCNVERPTPWKVGDGDGSAANQGKTAKDLFKADPFSPFAAKLEVTDEGKKQMVFMKVYKRPFLQHFKRSYPGGLGMIVEDPKVDVPVVFREIINQDWIVSLTKDASGDWKVAVELPGLREVVEEIGGPVAKLLKDLFGENYKFGVAVAGKGKSEVMGMPMYTLFKKFKIDKMMGMDENNAEAMNKLWFMNPSHAAVWGMFQMLFLPEGTV